MRRAVDAQHGLRQREVPLVVRVVGRRVAVVVAAVPVRAEPVEVLHAQVQILELKPTSCSYRSGKRVEWEPRLCKLTVPTDADCGN